MRLPKNILNPGTYAKPRIFLCETDKQPICQLETTNTSGALKFNSYSELTFEVARVYNDLISGATKVNPYYDKIEAPRLIYLEDIAYFELQGPGLASDGIKEAKSCTAYSLEYSLSTKFLTDFYVNTGKVDSLEVLNANDPNRITPIILYNPNNTKLSLLHLALEKVYGWKIGHVDSSLHKLSRQFEVDRESVYDFLMNEVCEKFNCYIVFDTIENTINIYAESLTSKFIGDGTTNTFTISPPFEKVGTVSIDGYKTSRWEYTPATGELVLEDAPEDGAHIEVVDGALTKWETDVFVTFDNLAQEININYDADSIKTVLTVTYGDGLDIREVNTGLPYITDISYFYTVDWMGQDLYDAYTAYMQKTNKYQADYTKNAREMIDISNCIDFEKNRLSLEYSVANSVNETTVGTYYVRGGEAPNYYYVEVSLPEDYDVNTTYYSDDTTNLQDGNDGNVSALCSALQKYFYNYFNLNEDDEIYETYQNGVQEALDDINGLADRFTFMDGDYTISGLHSVLRGQTSDDAKEDYIVGFFNTMWDQIGRTPLKELYYEPYKQAQIVHMEDGHSKKNNKNYGDYYVIILLLNSIEVAIAKRDVVISMYENKYIVVQEKNLLIANELIMENNFTDSQMIRLSAFLREDELNLSDIVETEITTVNESFKLKQDAVEAGRIEMQKISQPQLQFSMTMANIYALPEFEPIIDQFQLGNVIKVGLRRDYIKQSRLLQVNLNFDDPSDFSCEFGELTSLRSQSDIHADLLKKAVQAGKSVATNASYWTKGSEQANSIDLRLAEGLLNSIEALKAIDGTQNAYMDKYGIHLEVVVNPDTGEVGDKRIWMVNNQIVFTDDGFKTSKAALGEFEVDGKTQYGLLAQAVLAGYIEGSDIRGGTIKIGDIGGGKYNFEVDEDGHITMIGGKGISINGDIVDLDDYNTAVEIEADGSLVLSSGSPSVTLTCKVYSYGVDVTDNYDQSAFYWTRSTGDTTADNEWNASHYSNTSGNRVTITSSDVSEVAFFQCRLNKDADNVKFSNSISVTTSSADINVFTSKPDSILMNGLCYKKGDIWVVGDDYQPANYSQNTILVCTTDSKEYSDSDWVESVYCSQAFADVREWQDNMGEHVQIRDDGLHLIGPTDGDTMFESVLKSKQLTFRSIQGGAEQDVVWIGVDDMTARKTTIYEHLNVVQDPDNSDSALPYINLGGIRLQIESNGSLSITK